MAAHPRAELAKLLADNLPKSWRVVPAQRTIDPANRTTVIVKQSTIIKTPEAPAGARSIGFVLTIVSRFTDPSLAEDDLDSTVPDFLAVVDRIRNTRWTTATKVAVDEKHLGYDVEVTVVKMKGSL